MTVITTRNDSLVAFRVIHTIALEAAAACVRASLPRLSRALNFLRPFRDWGKYAPISGVELSFKPCSSEYLLRICSKRMLSAVKNFSFD